MSGVYFVSDLHLGHRTILKHTKDVGAFRGGTSVEEHDAWIIDQLMSVKPKKRTMWWLLGDIAMEKSKLEMLRIVPGRKMLILGNHDLFSTQTYLNVVERIWGGVKKYGVWLSHIPVHPEELRGFPNVHGHCHHHTLRGDARYLNCAIEWLPNQKPISLEEVREKLGV